MTAKEKMTAPIASVGADVEQPLSNKLTNQSIADLPGKGNLQATNNVENTAKSVNKKNPDDLETVSMMELYDTAYPPKLPIIDRLLYNGTYLFVGSPKIGKSFFMAQIGYHISKGLPLWGFSVRQGTVLYLALEDDYARLQKRLSQMFGMEGSENFYFATKSKSLNDGLERQLVTFVTEHKDARLIIIDKKELDEQNTAIQQKQKQLSAKKKELSEVKGWFKGRKKKELQGEIDALTSQIRDMQDYLPRIVQKIGYRSVQEFLKDFKVSKTEYSQYRIAIEKWKKETGKEPVAHGIRAKLAEKKQEIQNEQKNKQRTHKQNKDRGAR